MSRFYPNKFLASLAISALAATAVLTPGIAMANDIQVESTYNVQSTQSLLKTLKRLGGYDRFGTAIQIADYGWQSASTAVLAPSDDQNMVDALAASSLAKAVDGPILLADNDSVPSDTMTELRKLGVNKVYLVSGTTVVSAKVESDLLAAGIQVVRLGGYDRYETAVNIAKEIQKIKPFTEIVVTNAFANADAISIAPIAAAKGIPVLFVDKSSVPQVVSDFINLSGITKTNVIGGTAVVSDSVKDTFPNAIRIAGNDRYDTNTEVLKNYEDLIIGGKMFFANASETSLIDSLTSGPMVAKLGGAIVFSNKEAVPDGTKEYIQKNIDLRDPVILGGTAVMTDSTVRSIGYVKPDQSDIQNGAVELSISNATFKDKTVNGSLLVNAEGVTLENVVVKGTVFIDPGKDGSTTLDRVQATRIVVLSGADHSIYLKDSQAHSLVVSSSSDVHVVADAGTALDSTLVQSTASIESKSGANVGTIAVHPQSEVPIEVQLKGTFSNDVFLSGSVKLTAAEGTVVPMVKVTGAATADSIQLKGNFSSVMIDDNSSILVLSGQIDKLEAKGTSEVVVNSGAKVLDLTSESGSIKVSGGGTVNGKTTTETPTELSNLPVTNTSGNRDRIEKTELPTITGTVREGDNAITGTAEAGSVVSVTKNGVEIGSTTADETTGDFIVTLNDGDTLAKDDLLNITANKPGKSESNSVNVTVEEEQTSQPAVNTVREGDTTITGTAEAGATVSVKRNGVEIGSATADETTGDFIVTLNDGEVLTKGDQLNLMAIKPGKSESNLVNVTVEEEQTSQPVVNTVREGDTTITGTAEAGATVSVKRNGVEIGSATADETTGDFIVTLNDGEVLTKGDQLNLMAIKPGKSESNLVNVTVEEEQTSQPVVNTVREGDTTITGTAEAGAIVSVKRNGEEIGSTTADKTTGDFTVTLNVGEALAKDDLLNITATVPGRSESSIVNVEVDAVQTTLPTVRGKVGAGDTMIVGTSEAGASVSVKRSDVEIGTAIAEESTGIYMVSLSEGVTLAEDDVLSITATASGKSESSALSITVAAALNPTTQPTIMEPIMAGDTMIKGTTDSEAFVCVMRNGSPIGTSIADETGAFTVTLNDGVVLVEGDELLVVAKAPDKAMSEGTSVTVAGVPVEAPELIVPDPVVTEEAAVSEEPVETVDPVVTEEAAVSEVQVKVLEPVVTETVE